MIVHLFEPPPAQKTGGLEPAIRSLEAYLRGQDVTVVSHSTLERLKQSPAPDVVHFHGLWQPRFLDASAHCRRTRIPYVVSTHGMLEPWAWKQKRWKKLPWFYLRERPHLRGAARLLATSDSELQHLREDFAGDQCEALPLGLTAQRPPDYAEARRALGWSASESVLLFLSRLHPKKGLHLLLRALATLPPADVQRMRLVVVGTGPDAYVRSLKAFATRAQSRLPRIEWRGGIWDEGKWPYFQGADLFCLPSFSENFGLAVLEALQVGTPVLTTTQTPWSSLGEWGAGYVVEPTEADVRAALAAFLAAPPWRPEQRAALAAEIARQFSWDSVGPAYLRFYEDL